MKVNIEIHGFKMIRGEHLLGLRLARSAAEVQILGRGIRVTWLRK
jgi:hypothetical protein